MIMSFLFYTHDGLANRSTPLGLNATVRTVDSAAQDQGKYRSSKPSVV